MRRHGAPIWLVAPTRFAGIDQSRARIGLLLLTLLLAACLTALSFAGPRPDEGIAMRDPPGQTDQLLYQTVVDHVRHGEPYYSAAAEAQRAGGYPLEPFIAFRLPTLAVVQAALPPLAVRLLLWFLCLGTMVAWVVRLRPAMMRLFPVAVVGLLALAGLAVNLQPGLEVFHEIWAGPLIALSLVLRRPGDWTAAVAIGLCAMLVRETALLYVLVMAIAAAIEGQRREAIGWTAAMLVFAAALAAHAHAISIVAMPLDPHVSGGTAVQGFGFYVKLVTISTALNQLPQWLASLLLGLALFGWTAWRSATAVRAVTIFAGYAAVIALLGRNDDSCIALITTPLLLVGLVFAVDGLRDLLAAALDGRRITVTRVVR